MNIAKRGQAVFQQEIDSLQAVKSRLNSDFEAVVELIYNSSAKVVVTGIGKTGLIGQKIAASLASTGTQAVFMNATDAVHGDLGMVCAGDIVLAISNSGSTIEITNILAPLRKIGTTIVALTGRRESPLGREADFILDIAVDSEACPLGLAPTSSTTATLVMGDALCICLMEKRNFSREQYALYHPGGALGRQLLNRVGDLMTAEIPTVSENDSFKDVVFVISDRRKGMTMVVNSEGEMTGIITDGDIRRAIQRYDDILDRKAIDFMTKGFKKISEKSLINDALDLMTACKITTIVVDSAQQPGQIIGLLTIHDIIHL